MKIRHPAWLTQRPRSSRQPMKDRPAYLPAQRPDRGQQPIEILPFQDLSLEPAGHPGVLSGSIPKASSPLLCHSIPFQQPIKIEFFLDHPEIRGVYKPARIYSRQDSTANRQRDNFSRFGLSSPALQQPPTKPFSGSPSKHLMTDPIREAKEAGRQRPGIVYLLPRAAPLPRAARPDTRLSIAAAPPEAATLCHGEQPPMVVDIPEPERIGGTRLPEPLQPSGSRSPRR